MILFNQPSSQELDVGFRKQHPAYVALASYTMDSIMGRRIADTIRYRNFFRASLAFQAIHEAFFVIGNAAN
jgi:hypothetical protein